MKMKFREISTKRTVKFKDKNGKTRQVTKKFYQTINPWNQKSESQILEEITKEADDWAGRVRGGGRSE